MLGNKVNTLNKSLLEDDGRLQHSTDGKRLPCKAFTGLGLRKQGPREEGGGEKGESHPCYKFIIVNLKFRLLGCSMGSVLAFQDLGFLC